MAPHIDCDVAEGLFCIIKKAAAVQLFCHHAVRELMEATFSFPSEIKSLTHSWSEYTTCTMGKRYYCDYCDRSFQDNMHNRKKHLNGVQHHRAKKAWFDHFKGDFFFYLRNVNIRDDVVAVTAVNLQHNSKCVFVLPVQQVGLQ